ncbi:hypothetical protein F5B22DRAFT_32896 [Xylaria bambusicola]|uniref:uncharacterized protein n=1 Tax=Xylaria bambusicola TaxID=326684 RepID=UPI002007A123|nr:uncharacterized protein F5B22DRAFT_32896 [Xylaria bambusicola]KAI0520968.1 hypothetical protein F5B22DRAFT_32896 [Xylaria bambusicola]
MSSDNQAPNYQAPGEAEMWAMIRRGDEPFDVYRHVMVHSLFHRLVSWWLGVSLRRFDDFIASKSSGVCFIKLRPLSDPTSDMATQLAAYTLLSLPWNLKVSKHNSIQVIRERPHDDDRSWDAWTSLVRESIAVLSRLTHGKIKVKFDATADECIRAIEGASNGVVRAGVRTNPFRHFLHASRPILFVSGIDHDWNQRDDEQRQKVQSFVNALVSLFKDRGKLIFIVRPSYHPFDPEMRHSPSFVL